MQNFRMNSRGQYQALFFKRDTDGYLSIYSIAAFDTLRHLGDFVRSQREPDDIIRYRRGDSFNVARDGSPL